MDNLRRYFLVCFNYIFVKKFIVGIGVHFIKVGSFVSRYKKIFRFLDTIKADSRVKRCKEMFPTIPPPSKKTETAPGTSCRVLQFLQSEMGRDIEVSYRNNVVHYYENTKKIILLIFRGLYIDCASLKIIILYNYNDSLHECVVIVGNKLANCSLNCHGNYAPSKYRYFLPFLCSILNQIV